MLVGLPDPSLFMLVILAYKHAEFLQSGHSVPAAIVVCMSPGKSVAVQHMQHGHVLSEQSGFTCRLQPQHVMQQFDWFDNLLPEAITAERRTALLRLMVLAGAYLCSVWGFSHQYA